MTDREKAAFEAWCERHGCDPAATKSEVDWHFSLEGKAARAAAVMTESEHLQWMADRLRADGKAEMAEQYRACAASAARGEALRIAGAAGPLGDPDVLAALGVKGPDHG